MFYPKNPFIIETSPKTSSIQVFNQELLISF